MFEKPRENGATPPSPETGATGTRVNRRDVTLIIQDMVRRNPALVQVIAVPR